jgi:HK97 family phage prohead protease
MLNRAYSLLTIKEADDDARQITGMATTPTPDRLEDVVEPEGAQFKLPLALLWQHNSEQPIGRVTHARVTKAGIEIIAKIARTVETGRLKDRLDEAWQSIKAGLVTGLSIGFKPLEHEYIKETKGVRFTKWDWLELSVVTIPANAEANITTVRSIDIAQRAASASEKERLAEPIPRVQTVSEPSAEEKERFLAKLAWLNNALGGNKANGAAAHVPGTTASAAAVTAADLSDVVDAIAASVAPVMRDLRQDNLGLHQKVAWLERRMSVREKRRSGPFQGEWLATRSYRIGDCTNVGGTVWRCLHANTGMAPGISAAWELVQR